MASQTGLVSIAPASTTTATTTPRLLPASPGALRLHVLPRFGLKALYRNPRHSMVKYGTCLKIMVSPVRVRVPPLYFRKDLQVKRTMKESPRYDLGSLMPTVAQVCLRP